MLRHTTYIVWICSNQGSFVTPFPFICNGPRLFDSILLLFLFHPFILSNSCSIKTASHMSCVGEWFFLALSPFVQEMVSGRDVIVTVGFNALD